MIATMYEIILTLEILTNVMVNVLFPMAAVVAVGFIAAIVYEIKRYVEKRRDVSCDISPFLIEYRNYI